MSFCVCVLSEKDTFCHISIRRSHMKLNKKSEMLKIFLELIYLESKAMVVHKYNEMLTA